LSDFVFEQQKALLARGKNQVDIITGQKESSLTAPQMIFSTIWSNVSDLLRTSPYDFYDWFYVLASLKLCPAHIDSV
jgi:hypothetical protein